MNQFLAFVQSLLDLFWRVAELLPDHPLRLWGLALSLCSIGVGLIWSVGLGVQMLGRQDPQVVRDKAEALARSGEFARAKSLFLSLQGYVRAAQMAVELKEWDEALRLAGRSGQLDFVAEIYLQMKQFEKAAQIYEKNRKYAEAGPCWEQTGNLPQALECYRQANRSRKVEELLLALDRHEELGDFYVAEYQKMKAVAGASPSREAKNKLRVIATRAAQAYRNAKQHRKAFEVFMRSDQVSEAAKCMEDAGDLTRAADLYLQSGRGEDAARIWIQLEQYDRAADVYEEIGRLQEVPRLLKMAGRTEEAKAFEEQLAMAGIDKD